MSINREGLKRGLLPLCSQQGGGGCGSLVCDNKGIAAIEFAMLAPVLMILMIGSLETGMILLAQSVMESAIFDASRTSRTGYTEAGLSRDATIVAKLNQRAGVLLNTASINLNSATYGQFDQIGQPEPFIDANGNGARDIGENYTDVNLNGQYDTDMGGIGNGSASQIVVYTATYPWKLITPLMSQFIGTNGTYTIAARAVIQNDPF